MLCEIAPLSDQLLQTYCTPAVPACGDVVAIVCDDPTFQVSTSGAAVNVPPTTETRRLAGLVVTVICTVAATKFAVTLCGPLMVMVVLDDVELATLPVQLLKLKPEFAVARRGTTVPEL